MLKPFFVTAAILAGTSLLSGCIGAVAVGAVTATAATTDERSFGEVIDDQAITLGVTADITNYNKALLLDNNVVILTVNKKVLIVGQVSSNAERNKIAEIASQSEDVIQVYNQIRLGDSISFKQRSKDSWLTTKVKTSMLKLEGIKPLNMKVLTENSEVFLIGDVTRKQADLATEAARYVVGVDKVIKVFSYKD